MTIAGLRFPVAEDLPIGALNYLTWDVLNIRYAESSFAWSPVDGLGLRFTGQFTDQRSVGDDLLTGSAFDTRTFGGRVAAMISTIGKSSTSPSITNWTAAGFAVCGCAFGARSRTKGGRETRSTRSG